MAIVTAIVNQKGGVGKTTTAINLAAALAHKLDKKILLIDLDPQANATSGIGIEYRDLNDGVYESIIGSCELSDIILKTKVKNLFIAPSHVSLAGASIELVNEERREYRLKEAIASVKDDYDYILIDNPPSLGLLTLNGLVASENVLIPVQSEYYALEGLGQLLSTVQLVQEHLNPSLSVLGVVVTMFDKRNNLSSQILEELYQHFPYKIFRSIIPRNVRLTEAPSHGKSIFQYQSKSKGANAYTRFAKEFLSETL